MPKTVSSEDIERVWEAWRSRQRRPDLCRFTDHRVTRIRVSLRTCSVEDLEALVEFAFEADTRIARFWRGENDRHTVYTAIEQLLGPEKLGRRVEMALYWKHDEEPEPHHEGEDGTDLGPVGELRRRKRERQRGRTFGARVEQRHDDAGEE